jgi:hypothetical protein
MCDYGIDTTALSNAQTLGCGIYRNDVPWNFTPSGSTFTGIEAVAGTFSSANATIVANVVAAVKSHGMLPLMCVTVNTNPGLTSTWTSGPPSTPAQFASMMGWLVAQTGLQGLHWELFNEPDGSSWNIPTSLYITAFNAAYSAMKTADPTCIVHGMTVSNIATPASDYTSGGTAFYNAVIASITMDVCSIHKYHIDGSSNPINPSALDVYGYTYVAEVALFQAVRAAAGDSTPLWITECGWPTSSVTNQQQAQYFQNMFVDLMSLNAGASGLKAVCFYQMFDQGDNYGIYNSSEVAKSAPPIIAELISGH